MTPEEKQNLHKFLQAVVAGKNPDADKPLEGAFGKDGQQLTLRAAVQQNRVPDSVYERTREFFNEIAKRAEETKGEKLYTTEEVKDELLNRKPPNRGSKP